ncbi:hypothetical protein WG909_04250 [Peptostreptococcaceae bacterium AGR-M142]
MMSITRALCELKLLDKKINSKLNKSNNDFVEVKKESDTKIRDISVEKFNNNATSKYQSIIDLIERRKVIKCEIVKSNAINTVNIADKKYTVAEAIERKNSIIYEKMLLDEMKHQYLSAIDDLEIKNERMKLKLQSIVEAMVGKENTKNLSMDVSNFIKDYEKREGYKLVDPLKLKEKIDKLENDILEFESNVDFSLSESNSINQIAV